MILKLNTVKKEAFGLDREKGKAKASEIKIGSLQETAESKWILGKKYEIFERKL